MIFSLLKDLISENSSTKENANKTIDFCRDWLIKHDLEISIFENNGYKMLTCEVGTGKKTLILNGHVDVVSGKTAQFIPFEKNGKLYGRGAADMKAGVAAMMYAMAELKDKALKSKIQLQIVSDEEIGGFNCSKYLVEKGYRGDFVICGEPTQLGIGLQSKGILRFEIEVTGKSAHASRPWEGINAIEKAYLVYNQILKLPFLKKSTKFYHSPSINLAKIQGGDAFNKVPGNCLLSVECRFLPTQKIEEILSQIRTVTDEKITIGLTGEPVRTAPDNPYITSLIPIIEKHTSKETSMFGQHGSADTRFFSAYGIPAIEFGPSGADWHGDGEYVILESIKQYKEILVDFALSFHDM